VNNGRFLISKLIYVFKGENYSVKGTVFDPFKTALLLIFLIIKFMTVSFPFFFLTISSVIVPCYLYITTLQKSILDLQDKILFLENMIREQEKIIMYPPIFNLIAFLNDPVVLVIIKVLFFATSCYFISSTIAGTTIFTTGVENTCNFLIGTPSSVVCKMETDTVIRVIIERGAY